MRTELDVERASVPGPEGSGARRVVPARSEVTGLVLCGGESRRMGRDKAAIEHRGRRLIEYPVAALREVAERVLLCSGATPRYPELGLECVLDTEAEAGPLSGLMAGLEAARSEWVAVLACDLPRAGAPLLRELLAEASARSLDACLLELERGTQPLFAVYRRAPCAAAVRAALAAGERRMVSFHARLGADLVGSLLPEAASAATALNVNTPSDLQALERLPAMGHKDPSS